jgi:hypothetical protein
VIGGGDCGARDRWIPISLSGWTGNRVANFPIIACCLNDHVLDSAVRDGPPAFFLADDFHEKCGKWIAGFHDVR